MIIKESQIERIEELIEKGHTVQSSAIAGKKRYLAEIQDVLYSICKENNEETPIWVYLLQTAPVKIGSSGITVDVNLFIDKQFRNYQVIIVRKKMESEIKFTLCYFAANPSPNSILPKVSRLNNKRFRESFYGIFRTSCVDLQNRSFGLTEPFLWI